MADRPRIHREPTPTRRHTHHHWEVWIGPRWHSSHPTHASAITSATYWARHLAQTTAATRHQRTSRTTKENR